MGKFSGKTVMVTGAGKNIGKCIARMFAEAGANLLILDYNQENTMETASELRALGAEVETAVCDVRDRAAIFEAVERAAKRFGSIDVLINNAGGSAGLLGKLTRFADAEPETLDFVIDTNLKGSMHCTQAVLKYMIPQRSGKIIFMSSIAAMVGLINRVDYAAAKAAMIGMARALAIEVGEYNICVNCVSPGAIERDEVPMEHMTFLGENGHSGKPRDIAEAVLFLSSQDFITGQNLAVDGGRVLGPGGR